MLPAEMVTEDPVAPKVPLRDPLAPTTTLPKLRLAGASDNWPCAVPVPESAILSDELFAVETTASVPLVVPVALGPKVTVNVTRCCGDNVIGRLSPLTEKPMPLMFACEIVSADPPVLVSVSERLELLVVRTLPKESVDDDAARAGEPGNWACAIPVPESAILRVELSAVDTTARVPLADPVAVGAKITVNVTLCFGESAIGMLSPLIEKPTPPLMFAAEIVTDDAPVLLNVSESVELLLVCTLPNESVDHDAVRVEPGVAEFPVDRTGANPWQLVSSTIPVAIQRAGKKWRHHRTTFKGPSP
jgi:hypothetical protein